MELQFLLNDEINTITLERDGENYRAQIGDRVYRVGLDDDRSGGSILHVNDNRHNIDVASDRSKIFVAIDGDVIELTKVDAKQARRRKQHHGEDSLAASMPGQVTKVLVSEGDVVERGQTLILLEAMKMEIKVAAPHAGRVTKIAVKQGQVVDRGQMLIELME